MAINLGQLQISLLLNTRQYQRRLRAISAETQTQALGLQNSFLAALGTIGAVGLFNAASKAARGFASEIADVSTLTEMNMDRMSNAILELNNNLGMPERNARSLYEAISAGIKGTEPDLINFTGEIAKLSKAIRSDQMDTMDAVTTMMNAYGLKVKEVGHLSDWFFNVVKKGKVVGPELASSLGLVVSTASIAHISLEELGASIATLSRTMPAARAIFSLNQALNKIISPTQEAKKLAKQLGLDMSATALQTKGLTAVLEDMKRATGGNLEMLAKLVGGVRAQRAVFSLVGAQAENYRNILSSFSNIHGIADEAFAKQINTIAQSWENAKVAINKTFIEFTSGIAPIIHLIERVANKVLLFSKSLNDTEKEVLVVSTAFAALIPPVAVIIGLVTSIIAKYKVYTALMASSAIETTEAAASTTAYTAALSANTAALNANLVASTSSAASQAAVTAAMAGTFKETTGALTRSKLAYQELMLPVADLAAMQSTLTKGMRKSNAVSKIGTEVFGKMSVKAVELGTAIKKPTGLFKGFAFEIKNATTLIGKLGVLMKGLGGVALAAGTAIAGWEVGKELRSFFHIVNDLSQKSKDMDALFEANQRNNRAEAARQDMLKNQNKTLERRRKILVGLGVLGEHERKTWSEISALFSKAKNEYLKYENLQSTNSVQKREAEYKRLEELAAVHQAKLTRIASEHSNLQDARTGQDKAKRLMGEAGFIEQQTAAMNDRIFNMEVAFQKDLTNMSVSETIQRRQTINNANKTAINWRIKQLEAYKTRVETLLKTATNEQKQLWGRFQKEANQELSKAYQARIKIVKDGEKLTMEVLKNEFKNYADFYNQKIQDIQFQKTIGATTDSKALKDEFEVQKQRAREAMSQVKRYQNDFSKNGREQLRKYQQEVIKTVDRMKAIKEQWDAIHKSSAKVDFNKTVGAAQGFLSQDKLTGGTSGLTISRVIATMGSGFENQFNELQKTYENQGLSTYDARQQAFAALTEQMSLQKTINEQLLGNVKEINKKVKGGTVTINQNLLD